MWWPPAAVFTSTPPLASSHCILAGGQLSTGGRSKIAASPAATCFSMSAPPLNGLMSTNVRSSPLTLTYTHVTHWCRQLRLLISAPSLGVYYFFCRWLCISVCHGQTSNCFFFFVSFLFLGGIEPFFWPSVLHVALYKTVFWDFWFRPPNAQNWLPKICKKMPISRLVWQIDRRCLHLPGGFRGWPIQWNHTKCCGADPCCHGNIWARRGDLVAYRLVCLSVASRALSFIIIIIIIINEIYIAQVRKSQRN